MTAALTSLSATEIAARVRDGTTRAADVTDAFLARIAAHDGELGAFLEVFAGSARAEAEAVDLARSRGLPLGRLAGVPVALKDNLVRRGYRTTCASRILAGFVSPYTATAVARLEAAGAVILGRTNLDEFAMGSSTEHGAFGPTRNPFDPTRIAGGSSGGSAVAVAARLAPLALGSDTGGSVRQPAALCGVPGLKPTYGRISRFGLVAYASSLDCVGVFGRSVVDLGLALAVLAGHDPQDATSLEAMVPDYPALLGENGTGLRGLRIGVVAEQLAAGVDPEVAACVRAALDRLEELGATLVDVTLPLARASIPAYYLVATSEAAANLARYDGVRYGLRADGDFDLETMVAETRARGFGAEVKLRILLGTFCLCSGYYDAWYLQASKVRAAIRAEHERAFAQCDVLAGPTSPIPAFPLGTRLDDPLAMYLCDVLTVGANLAGIPALSVPCGFTGAGLPVGLQLSAPALGEPRLLQVAAAYAAATRHHLAAPPAQVAT